ncbi:dihydropteroate synthase [Pontibacter sp. G13]|uniref:dihydropteroate synthase n=1 Tax=Pontibacter sp. G13 TaxID=3074898 RepID=UPI00288C5AE8|nr:dihydropteroate synthase [Pontibacter sp. G13]WNJ20853.1 dihydropteroate synthase [Pontibacter sp. G13]
MLELSTPQVMGILNVTPDSFSDGGQWNQLDKAIAHAEEMLSQGASLLDIGGYSSRPYADEVSLEEEWDRVGPVLEACRKRFPEALISVDTFRPEIASRAIESGAHIINDIKAGLAEPDHAMMEVVAKAQDVPYIMMHMQGEISNMQDNPQYQDVCATVWDFFVERMDTARAMGVRDLVIDPGFGFGKSFAHNYQLLGKLDRLAQLGAPVLVGISRKSMMYKLLETTPQDVLPETSLLHGLALERGAHILRVHDVKQAVRAVTLITKMQEYGAI